MVRLAKPLMLAAVILGALSPASAQAEQGERPEPLLALHLQPTLSVLLPSASSTPVTDVYGLAQPGGAIGVSLHLVERFTLVLELEAQGWHGALPAIEGTEADEALIAPFDLRFLNYWLHLRGRVMLLRAGIFQLHLDAIIGMIFGREDGERFRAEGQGVALGAGPVAWLSLGRYFALSLSAVVESGWVFYDVVSAQGRSAEISYSLTWPRVMIGLGLHGIFVHRSRRRRPPTPPAITAPTVESEPAPAEEPPPAVEGEEELESPW